jgi:hypothetical protein
MVSFLSRSLKRLVPVCLRTTTIQLTFGTLQLPKVVTHFNGYKPPFDPVPIIERMLASVPPK